MVSPSMSSALAQTLQAPGVSGMENNTVLFEMSVHDEPSIAADVLKECKLAAARMNLLVLRHTDRFFRDHRSIDLWITEQDDQNAVLMILLAYILLGHPDWREGEMRILAAFPDARMAENRARLTELIVAGRIPVSEQNIRILPIPAGARLDPLLVEHSAGADLIMLGFSGRDLERETTEVFRGLDAVGDVLLVSAGQPVFFD